MLAASSAAISCLAYFHHLINGLGFPSIAMDSTEDEMNVYLKVIKTVALKVKRSETTKKLKALFHEEEGSPENLQELFFTGKQLQDDHKLVDYGIQMNSTLHLFLQTIDRLKLLVYIPSNAKQFEVEAKSCETVENIKLLIQTKEGILSDQFTLFTNGKLLEENRTLASLNICSELILYLVFNPRCDVSFCETAERRDPEPEVKVLHTICDFKAVIRSFVCFVDIDEQNLTYAGKLLENSKTLAYYDIKENSLLEKLPFTYQIFLMDLDGKTHFLRVCKEDRVRDVKSNILHWFGVSVHCYNLAYAGKILKDHEDLATYNIVKHSHLHVVFRGSIPKFVQISL